MYFFIQVQELGSSIFCQFFRFIREAGPDVRDRVNVVAVEEREATSGTRSVIFFNQEPGIPFTLTMIAIVSSLCTVYGLINNSKLIGVDNEFTQILRNSCYNW
ncbi:hypothetical protein D3C80_1748950 [compost metagenome]